MQGQVLFGICKIHRLMRDTDTKQHYRAPSILLGRRVPMSAKRIEILLLLGFAFSACHVVAAQTCWSYIDPPPGQCSGAGGCTGSYPRTLCFTGCVSGTCYPDGASAECCGQIHYYAVGYEWGGLDCSDFGCGAAPTRRARSEVRKGWQGKITALQIKPGYGPLSYRPRVVFVPNRCTREYDAFFEDLAPLPERGM